MQNITHKFIFHTLIPPSPSNTHTKHLKLHAYFYYYPPPLFMKWTRYTPLSNHRFYWCVVVLLQTIPTTANNSSGLNKTGPHTHMISAVILQRLLYYNTKEWRAYTLALHTIYNSIIYLIKDIQL